MELLRKFDKCVLLLACVVSSSHLPAQVVPTRVPVSAADVTRCLQKAGVSVNPSNIQLPQNITATTSQVVLKVTGADLMGDGRIRIRLSCQELGACQPFFAVAGITPGTEMATVNSLRSATGNEKHATSNPAIVRAGGQAQMFLEDDRMSISVPVLTIDSGAVGAEIRVSSLDHKQVFRAFVVSAGVVRSVLP